MDRYDQNEIVMSVVRRLIGVHLSAEDAAKLKLAIDNATDPVSLCATCHKPIPDEPYQERVVTELKELREKRGKLGCYVAGNNQFGELPMDEQRRMRRQLDIMVRYESILQERIDHFRLPESNSGMGIGYDSPNDCPDASR